MCLKPAGVAAPPDVGASQGGLAIRPLQLAASQVLAFLDSLEHRAVAVSSAADVVHLTGARKLKEMPKRVHQIEGMDIVAHLLAPIIEDDVRGTRHRAFYEVGQK